jgi:hypothetical protein
MRQFTIAAATVAIAALISAAPASAEQIDGGPIQPNGKCWHGHGGASESSRILGIVPDVVRVHLPNSMINYCRAAGIPRSRPG